MSEDCYYYLYSTCTKKDCKYRHNIKAKETTIICPEYSKNKPCQNDCPFRHSNYHLKKNRSELQCYWEEHGECKKLFCEFKHKNKEKDKWKSGILKTLEEIKKQEAEVKLAEKRRIEEIVKQNGENKIDLKNDDENNQENICDESIHIDIHLNTFKDDNEKQEEDKDENLDENKDDNEKQKESEDGNLDEKKSKNLDEDKNEEHKKNKSENEKQEENMVKNEINNVIETDEDNNHDKKRHYQENNKKIKIKSEDLDEIEKLEKLLKEEGCDFNET